MDAKEHEWENDYGWTQMNADGNNMRIYLLLCPRLVSFGSAGRMTHSVHFERPSFEEIVAAIRRIFPVAGDPEFGLTPDSISRYFAQGKVELPWQRIPDWESYEYGRREISDEEFVRLLFSPSQPLPDERIIAVTDESFCESPQRGFSFRFSDLLPFAREVYPQIVSQPMDFFQPSDTIFVAEQSRLLVLLHHGGVSAQFVG